MTSQTRLRLSAADDGPTRIERAGEAVALIEGREIPTLTEATGDVPTPIDRTGDMPMLIERAGDMPTLAGASRPPDADQPSHRALRGGGTPCCPGRRPARTKTNCPGAVTARTNDERPDESTPEEIGR
ncbi:hypothetical protein ACQPXM_09195 [Kribbella sp. CA-253562]|uniref:hypothetical protein n=1 Tax=Kribbella sp. CA-253562 TaxID=3239942 RepID=UPI003D908EBD